jgi:hypothetical protein
VYVWECVEENSSFNFDNISENTFPVDCNGKERKYIAIACVRDTFGEASEEVRKKNLSSRLTYQMHCEMIFFCFSFFAVGIFEVSENFFTHHSLLIYLLIGNLNDANI